MPGPQFLDHEVIERHGFFRSFGLHIPQHHLHHGANDVHLLLVEIDVVPLQSDQLAAAESASAIEQHHGPLPLVECRKEPLKLVDVENGWNAPPFPALPNVLHRVCFPRSLKWALAACVLPPVRAFRLYIAGCFASCRDFH